MSISEIQAIDVHAHFGRMIRGRDPHYDDWLSGDGATIVDRARQANTRLSIVSPLASLMPRGHADAHAGNEEAAGVVSQTEGLLQWVVLNPLQESTYDQVQRMLDLPKCVGVKIHPEEHRYPIKEHGRPIFEFAAKNQAIVLTHSGQELSMPEDFVPFLDDFPQVKLILAHIGCTSDEDPTHQVRAIQMGRHDNLFADTSSAQSMLSGVIEFAVHQVGARRILYGTDSPLYFAAAQRARIDQAELNDDEKRMILRDNAVELFGLDCVRQFPVGRGSPDPRP